jgi:tripartite-type tricarboxylate transporter receptor subunit TctC
VILRFLPALLLSAGAASAQEFPTGTVKVVSPYTDGGSNDAVARLLAAKLAQRWGKPVIVENKPGANAITGSDHVAKARPDGHTLLAVPAAYVTNPFLQPKMPFSPLADLTAVSIVDTIPFMLAVNPQVPARTLQELVAQARTEPGETELRLQRRGLWHAPRGRAVRADCRHSDAARALSRQQSGPAGRAVGTGVDDLRRHPAAGAAPAHRQAAGALAVSSTKRWPTEADVPTAVESGLPAFVAETWIPPVTTAGTLAPVTEKIARDVAAVLEMPDVREKLNGFGIAPVGGTPASANRFIADESAKWGKVIQSANIRIN